MTSPKTDPTGDERAFALSRQARLMPIVATQSISSLRSALPGDESWRTLLQCFRTKVFLATSDEFTARAAAELCGKRDRLKAHYSISETGQGAHISLLTGRAMRPALQAPHDRSALTLEFAASSLLAPRRIEYQERLWPLEPAWSATHQRQTKAAGHSRQHIRQKV